MGSSMAKGHVLHGVTPFRLSINAWPSEEQFIRRPKLSSAKPWRNNRLDSLQLLGRIGPNVNFGGRQITVPQPQRNFPNVLSCLEHHHCAGMAPMSLAT